MSLEVQMYERNINTLCPLDNRYSLKLKDTSEYFSEHAFITYRVFIEFRYYVFLCSKLKNYDVYYNLDWTIEDSYRVIKLEKTLQHDVKAIEYILRDKLTENKCYYTELIHWGLTSQDINNTAYNCMIMDYTSNVLLKKYKTLLNRLLALIEDTKDVIIPSYTHGQEASPTSFGKELHVFWYRLNNQLQELEKYTFKTKFGGAVGNLSIHRLFFSEIEWEYEISLFLREEFNLERHSLTTQIDNYDYLSIFLDTIKRINTILLDLSNDMWLYISKGILIQKTVRSEVGSSTMPHKVNPIHFENAEGNFHLCTSLIEMFTRKLPVSRLQRDLSDSTILRNIGTLFGYHYLGIDSLIIGLSRVDCDREFCQNELKDNYKLLTEALQYGLKLANSSDSYDTIKNISRGELFSKEDYLKIVEEISDTKIREVLLKLVPENFY